MKCDATRILSTHQAQNLLMTLPIFIRIELSNVINFEELYVNNSFE